MSTMTKVFIVLTSVLWVAASCFFIAAAAQMTNWKELAQDYQTLQQAAFQQRMNQEIIGAASEALKDDSLRQKTQELETTQRQKADLSNQLGDAENKLARETNEKVSAEAGRKKLEEILGVQTGELTALQKLNQTLLQQNMDLQTRNTRLNSRVLELTSNVTIMTDQLRNLQEKLYASEQQVANLQQRSAGGGRATPTGAAPQGAVPVSPLVAGPIRGAVTEIDGTYASVNVGETSGVVTGMTFMVHRGTEFVAELVIDRVRPKEAGGKLRTLKLPVQVGDTVAYGLEGAGN